MRVAATAEGERLRFEVEDDGPGLAESDREAVMERGHRLDESVPGSGLGLAIVQDIADLYGGRLTLSAATPNGLHAELGLPAADPDPL